MTAMSGIKICVYCDQPIEGAALPVGPASTSGAGPDLWRHVKGDPACRVRPSRLQPRQGERP